MLDPNEAKKLLSAAIYEQNWDAAGKLLSQMHAADIAETISQASASNQYHIFSLLDPALKSQTLIELDTEPEQEILNSMTAQEISDLVKGMAPDDSADVLGEIEKRREKVLHLMEARESKEVRELLQYKKDTAGGIMTTSVLSLLHTATVDSAIRAITGSTQRGPFYFAYVVDENKVLVGYVALWDLLKVKNRATLLRDITLETHAIDADTDQEKVAHMMSKYDLSSIPVTNKNGQLEGRITFDDIMEVLEDEASEDIFKLAGSNESELDFRSPLSSCKARLPWLLITLATGFVSSMILKSFIHQLGLSEILVLSFFVPIIMAMGGNTGIQSSTLVIRRLALESFDSRHLFKILGHEILTGAVMGLFCGLIIGIWASLLISFDPDASLTIPPSLLAGTVSLALFMAMAFAAVFGSFIPITLNAFNVDPAVASGPFVTSSNDIFALLIYYGTTALMLGAIT